MRFRLPTVITAAGNAREIQRNVEHEADVVGAGLAQRRAQVELFALMMSDVRRPHDAPLVAEAMLPVAEVVGDERGDPLPRRIHRPLLNPEPLDQRAEHDRREAEPQHVDQPAERASCRLFTVSASR